MTIQFAAAALSVGLVLAAAWQISIQMNQSLAAYILTIGTIIVTFFTRWHPLYLVAAGAACGLISLI